MKNFLDFIEHHLRSLLENDLNHLFTFKGSESITEKILYLLVNKSIQIENGKVIAPDRFIFLVPSKEFDLWMEKRPIFDDMAQEIYTKGIESGLLFTRVPSINIQRSEDPGLPTMIISATISPAHEQMHETIAIEITDQDPLLQVLPNNAFLIINGTETFPLTKPVINIGRRSTSDLVVDDSLVSRDHLQLRSQNSKYIFFDLGSLGGTFLNGQKCLSALLNNGDMIRIGNTNIIYGDESENRSSPTTHQNIVEENEENK
jgi:hypothetical protein